MAKLCFTPFGLLCLVSTVTILTYLHTCTAISIYQYFKLRKEGWTERPRESNSADNDQFSYQLNKNNIFGKMFYYHGVFVAKHYILVILVSLLFAIVLSSFNYRFSFIVDPVHLWTSVKSESYKEKVYFDTNFGPFYRIEISILTKKNTSSEDTIIDKGNLMALGTVYNHLSGMVVEYGSEDSNGNRKKVRLEDVCFKPLAGKGCLVNSALGYFQNNVTSLENQENPVTHIEMCTGTFAYTPICMNDIGMPVDPKVVFGGYEGTDYMKSKSLNLIFLLSLSPSNLEAILAWEQAYLDYWASNPTMDQGIEVAYSSERSLQDEMSKEQFAAVPAAIVSYVAMFIYIVFALGTWKRPYLVNCKFSLALAGIFTVIASILASSGLCSLLGFKATLIISEVIPFLTLTIGIDNIFILVDAFEAMNSMELSFESKLGNALAQVGSSMLVAFVSESTAFAIGLITDMPAVTSFAIYAFFSIAVNFLLQITFFLAVIALDAKRRQARRIDLFCCFSVPQGEEAPSRGDEYTSPFLQNEGSLISSVENRKARSGLLPTFIRTKYLPVVLHPIVKKILVFLFMSMFIMSCMQSTKLKVGLPYDEVLPASSYLTNYFKKLATYQKAGPPFYLLVSEPLDYGSVVNQNKLCSTDALPGGCSSNSLMNEFHTFSLSNDTSFIKGSSLSSWIDAYLLWLDPSSGCCKKTPGGVICTNNSPFSDQSDCSPCLSPADYDSHHRPSKSAFYAYLDIWLTSPCGMECSSCGSSFVINLHLNNSNSSNPEQRIISTRFQGYHRNLVTQSDYIEAITESYQLARKIRETQHIDVIPYSNFYIYFEQYIHIYKNSLTCISLAILCIFLGSLLFLRNVYAAFIVSVIVMMVEIDVVGVMSIWDVSFNALSLVNLIMIMGLSVEFCIHICYAFVETSGSKEDRVFITISNVGTSVIRGIFLTKFVGIVPLAFASSLLFKIYYFRMFFATVAIAATHAFVFLPIILSSFGPRTNHRMFQLY
ncbi:NPC intracellular cholesterol transporter 1-like isoform X2 [Schistocerca gregaria]|nr:NPC intracellular cholesterol transporter 1-like isoform X2 [Schistocerca gregaria]